MTTWKGPDCGTDMTSVYTNTAKFPKKKKTASWIGVAENRPFVYKKQHQSENNK